MARPKKQSIDYFPHYVKGGKTLFTLEAQFGNSGYAFWFKLLELLGDTVGHYYDCNVFADWSFLIAKTKVSEETAQNILNILAQLGAIDNELWDNKIIWIQNLVDNVEDVYRKRGQVKPKKPSFCHGNTSTSNVSDTESTQSKVKESKVNKNKEKESNKSSKVFADDSIPYRLSLKLKEFILKNNPEARTPEDLQKWSMEIDKMIRIDNRDPKKIYEVMEFSQKHNFWLKNILSPASLRKHFDKLILEKKQQDKPKQTGSFEMLRELYEEAEDE